jgi:hypothetical protein
MSTITTRYNGGKVIILPEEGVASVAHEDGCFHHLISDSLDVRPDVVATPMPGNCYYHAGTLSRQYRGPESITFALLDLSWFTAVMDLAEPVI